MELNTLMDECDSFLESPIIRGFNTRSDIFGRVILYKSLFYFNFDFKTSILIF